MRLRKMKNIWASFVYYVTLVEKIIVGVLGRRWATTIKNSLNDQKVLAYVNLSGS